MSAPHGARESSRWALAGVLLLVLTALSVQLRTRAIDTSYWIDEGIAVGIARYPLADIPGVLLKDGSPPLYYLLLHVWETWLGTSEPATRSLSLVAATLTIPLGFFLGMRIAGARAAWICALLAAGHPFLTYYAQETRMYAFVALLSLLLAGALVLVFVERRRAAIPWAILAATGMAYSHNWGLFAVAASFVAALLVVLTGPRELRRASVVDGVIVYGATGAAFLPWLPSLLEQAGSTGAPWALAPRPMALVEAVVVPFGYEMSGLVLALVTGAAWLGIARRARRGEHRERDRAVSRAALLLFVTIVVAGWLAWAVSQVSPAWSLRYLAVSVGPALLLAGLVLSRVPAIGAAVLVLLAVTWAQPLVERVREKSNVAQVASLSHQTGSTPPGTVLISPHPEQLPVIAHYFGPHLRYATALGFQRDTRVFDWRDGMDRLQAARPGQVWREQIRPTLEPGDTVILAVPILRSARWRAPWTDLVRTRTFQWQILLDGDPGLARVGELPRYGDRPVPRGLRAIVFRMR